MSNESPYVADSFDPRDSAAIAAIEVPVAATRRLDLLTLIGAWERHVNKIQNDLDLPDSDRTVWGAHDLAAALGIRSFVQQGIDVLPARLASVVTDALVNVDEHFLACTEDDVNGRIQLIDARSILPREWWWRRIPRRGPIRRELDLIAHRIEIGGQEQR